MNIFGKMLLAFGTIIVLYVGLNLYNITQSNTLKDTTVLLQQHGLEPTMEMIEIARLTENTRVQMLTALNFKNLEATTVALQNLEVIQAYESSITPALATPALQAAYKIFNDKWLLFDARVRLNEQMMRADDWAGATAGLKIGGPLFNDAMDAFTAFQQAHIDEMAQMTAQNEQTFATTLTLNYVFMTLVLVAALLLAYFFSRQFVKRLQLIVERAKQIADGDLSLQPLSITSKDEIASVAHNLNDMQVSLIRVVGQANDSSQQVSASAEELSATTQENITAAQEIAAITEVTETSSRTQLNNLTEITDSLESLHHTVQDMAHNGQKMTNLSNITYEKTQNGVHAVEAIHAQIGLISDTAKETEVAIKELNSKSQEIGKIVEMITDIASQTNLLSLNAAIEAARAGESGKGFAVVADEVRKLADQSRHSAEQIFDMIRVIQDDIQGVIHSIHEESNRVNEGFVKSQEVRTVFSEIEQMVGHVTNNTTEMNTAIEAISCISTQIVTNTQQVHALANHSLTDAQKSRSATEIQLGGVEEIAMASNSLADLSEELQRVISHFRLRA
ncbi:MAG: methyl-accepting chemotaxis protein [Solibacillus sp.]